MAAEKNFTEIRYFVKNATTTTAFAQTFVGSADGLAPAYPMDDLDFDTRFTDIINNYEIKGPIALANTCTLTDEDATVTATSGTPFTTMDAKAGDYLLYDDGAGFENLKVLGVIATPTTGATNTVELANPAIIDTNGPYTVYYIKKGSASVGFKANSPFYILVKSSTFGSSLRDGVLWLSTPGTHSSEALASADPSLGWGGGPGIPVNINTDGYFNFFAISEPNAADIPAIPIVETDIPCTIKRVSFYYNAGSNFVNTDNYPYWVAYEINPYGDSSSSLTKKTTFKVQLSEDLPAGQLSLTGAYTWISSGAL